MSELNIWNKLNSEIKNDFGTSSLMGNLFAESGLKSINLQNSCEKKCGLNDSQYTQAVDNGSYNNFVNDRFGYGLAQWTSSGRKQGILNYAKSKRCSIGDENMQIEYVLYELKTAYKTVWNALVNAKSVKQASDIVLTQYERPADQSENAKLKRASYGEIFYRKYHKETTNMNIKIAIDAGHGNNTAGKRTPDGYREHWANVKVANYFAQAMERCGISYQKVGWNDINAYDDIDISLTTRQAQIKNGKCTHSVSFHFNAYGNGNTYNSADGIVTFISDKSAGDSLRMAQIIHKHLIQGTKQTNRGVKTQALSMCNCGIMGTKASVLIECGFMTNKRESELMQSDAFCLECAEETAKGFCEYVGIKYVQLSSSVPTTPSNPISPNPVISISPINIVKGNPLQFNQIIVNIKHALNLDFGLKFVLNPNIDEILFANLSNVVLSTSAYKSNITYALQQLMIWWGYSIAANGVYDINTHNTVRLFQSQVRIMATGTTTKEFWYKILGRRWK